MPEFKTRRNTIPCAADPEYNHSQPDDDEFCCPPPHLHPQPDRHPRPYPHHKNEVEFACGSASGLPLPVNVAPLLQANGNGTSSYNFTPLVAGTVTLDTSGMTQPTVKVDFSSTVNFLIDVSAYEAGLLISIDFRLVKICNGSRVPLGTWTYRKSISLETLLIPLPAEGLGLQIDFREPFSFSWCECQECPSCCTYVVEIANLNSYDIASASLTNVDISALAVG